MTFLAVWIGLFGLFAVTIEQGQPRKQLGIAAFFAIILVALLTH